MNVLEKILEEIREIEKKYVVGHNVLFALGATGMATEISSIIRSHMDDVSKCGECSRRKWYQMGYEDATEGSTYIESINGLAAFDGGSMSGWMYSDSAEGWSKSCNIPMVGGADYVLTDGARITWFYTCDYTIYWH